MHLILRLGTLSSDFLTQDGLMKNSVLCLGTKGYTECITEKRGRGGREGEPAPTRQLKSKLKGFCWLSEFNLEWAEGRELCLPTGMCFPAGLQACMCRPLKDSMRSVCSPAAGGLRDWARADNGSTRCLWCHPVFGVLLYFLYKPWEIFATNAFPILRK